MDGRRSNERLPLFPDENAPPRSLGGDEELIAIGAADLKDGEMRGVEFGDYGICLANIAGTYHAIEDSCNHSGALLSGGRIEAGIVTCPRHFLRFSMLDGELQTNPKICDAQKVFPVIVKDGQLFVVTKRKSDVVKSETSE
jgi:nitrite reductase/ring-hydroxylating ferredoxin subunit